MINKILIIEDDPMVAMLNQEFLIKILPTCDIKIAKKMSDALAVIETEQLDLLLVDVYLPDGTGLELLEQVSKNQKIPSILITAANDTASVKKSLELGVIDYLIKPFKFDRFTQAINKAVEHSKLIESQQAVEQSQLDMFFSGQGQAVSQSHQVSKLELPKGLTHFTLVRVIAVLLSEDKYVSLKDLTNQLEISRITIKKYLDYLEEMTYLEVEMTYLEQGRPLTKYKVATHAIAELEKIK